MIFIIIIIICKIFIILFIILLSFKCSFSTRHLLIRHLSICFDKYVLLNSLLQNSHFTFCIEKFYTCTIQCTIFIFVKICFQYITHFTSFLLLQSSHSFAGFAYSFAGFAYTELSLLFPQIKHFICLVKKLTKSTKKITESMMF